MKALLRLHICTGSSGPCLLAYAINSLCDLVPLTFSQQRMLRLTCAPVQSRLSYRCSLMMQRLNAEIGLAISSGVTYTLL